ncbi:MAG TPA: tryptophan--tRNA ligase [Fibrobacteres bacterium]|jgi:tryptophanyl-tRNA synthetase|nr:tryptophan--tRNA ligase [Fibrobacterota bacterium]
MAQRALTGVKPTGEPHLGNWLGAIQPALDLARSYDTFYFIADYHALTSVHAGDDMRRYVRSITATYLAFGLDPEKSVFYRQSDVPEIFELSWILSCFTPKGFMNRAHAYKDAVSKNLAAGKDADDGIGMGLFGYPVLMAADILMFNADVVPVGADQKQHVEFARDIAERFNGNYGEAVFHLPEPRISSTVKTVIGLDGRKMSKSYDNTIPLFLEEKALLKRINQIVTNSQSPEEPKDPDQSHVFSLHQLLLDANAEKEARKQYQAGGMGWGMAKKMFFESLNEKLRGPRSEYNRLIADPNHLDRILEKGKERARSIATPFLDRIRLLTGIR